MLVFKVNCVLLSTDSTIVKVDAVLFCTLSPAETEVKKAAFASINLPVDVVDTNPDALSA